MVRFTIKLADVAIGVNAIYPDTLDFCRDYLTEEVPQITVTVFPEDLEPEADITRRKSGAFPLPYLETLALYRKIAQELTAEQVLLFHGALISVDGGGILFTAPSGTGKTTHIGLWKQVYGDRVTIINGDKPLLKMTREGVFGYGTPWQGKENYGCPGKVRLRAVCHLTRGTENSIVPISFSEALPVLLQQSHRPAQAAGKLAAIELVGCMQGLPCYRLNCNMELQAAVTAYEGML